MVLKCQLWSFSVPLRGECRILSELLTESIGSTGRSVRVWCVESFEPCSTAEHHLRGGADRMLAFLISAEIDLVEPENLGNGSNNIRQVGAGLVRGVGGKSQFPHESVYSIFIVVIVEDKLTDLCGN